MVQCKVLLYKYVNIQDGLDIIKNLRIKVQNIVDFNDPFEMSGDIPLNAPDEHKIHTKDMRENSCQYFRVSCFCSPDIDPRNDIVMWSHYAKKHEGFRIHFEIEKEDTSGHYKIEKVNYCEERLKDPCYTENISSVSMNEIVRQCYNFYDKLKFSKSIAWSYEHECRLIASAKYCMSDGENFYHLINAENIVCIDFGCRCPLEKVLTIASYVRQAGFNHMALKRAVIDENKFKMEYVDISHHQEYIS